jgi:rod shape determining protein RodA
MISLRSINIPLFLSSLLLISIGVLVIYSSSSVLALQQFLYAFFGLLLFLFVSNLDLYSFRRIIKPLYLLTIIMLFGVYLLGIETRGSVRWIPLGFFNIQPSEFAKAILIMQLGLFWNKRMPSWINILKSLGWLLPIALLIFKQPDLGTTLTIVAIWIGMLFAARISFGKVLVLVLIASLVIPSSYIFLHDYQKQRIIAFLQPGSDPLGRGYNVIQSTIAVGSGQLTGLGLGRGTQSRLQFLPEFRTDFIFASIAEEMGFFGSLIILSIYVYLLMYCLRVANETDDKLYFLIIIGVYSMLLFQIFVNVGMNIGLLPITGITLPLISYGGSSLIATLLCLGLVSSVAKRRQTFDTSEL